jgi:hypothetical protein
LIPRVPARRCGEIPERKLAGKNTDFTSSRQFANKKIGA